MKTHRDPNHSDPQMSVLEPSQRLPQRMRTDHLMWVGEPAPREDSRQRQLQRNAEQHTKHKH